MDCVKTRFRDERTSFLREKNSLKWPHVTAMVTPYVADDFLIGNLAVKEVGGDFLTRDFLKTRYPVLPFSCVILRRLELNPLALATPNFPNVRQFQKFESKPTNLAVRRGGGMTARCDKKLLK